MTSVLRPGLWILLCLVGGAACAFLTLEVAGIPYVLVFIAGLVFLSRRFHLSAESLGAFGVGFTLLATPFVVRDISFSNAASIAASAFFVGVLAIGIALMVIAIVIRPVNRWFRR